MARDLKPGMQVVTDTISLLDKDGNLRPLADIEAEVIANALVTCRGRMSEAARRLGIGRSTIYRKLATADQQRATNGETK